jgi:hypothetical protein
VEHPLRVTKRQFGFTKVRYRGLAKNTARLHCLFALANLYLDGGACWQRQDRCVPMPGVGTPPRPQTHETALAGRLVTHRRLEATGVEQIRGALT